MPGLKSPIYTQYPNEILDNIHELKESELKVMSVLCRYTFGFHRTKWRAKLTTLMDKTGMSRQGVLNGAAGLIQRGWIKQIKGGVSEWEIQIDGEVYLVDHESLPSRPPSKKETIRKKKDLRDKSRDTRLDHPAIQMYRSKARLHVPIVMRDIVIEKIGENEKDVDAWGETIVYWIGSGWKPGNVRGMLEVHAERTKSSRKDMEYA